MDAHDHLDHVLAERTTFHISEYFSEGFTMWREHAKAFIIFTLLLCLVQAILTALPLGDLANEIWFRHAAGIGGALVSYRIFSGLSYEANDFMKGFQFSAQIIVAHLLMVGTVLVLCLPFFLAIGISSLSHFASFPLSISRELLAGVAFWMVLLVLPIIFVLVLFVYVDYFIVFYKLSALDAIKYSVKFVLQHWLSVFGFFILNGLLVISGLLGFIIGIVVTISMVFPIMFYSFQDLTKLSEFEQTGEEIVAAD